MLLKADAELKTTLMFASTYWRITQRICKSRQTNITLWKKLAAWIKFTWDNHFLPRRLYGLAFSTFCLSLYSLTLANWNYQPPPGKAESSCDALGWFIIMSPCVDWNINSWFAYSCEVWGDPKLDPGEPGLFCLDPPFLDKIGMCQSREMGLHYNLGISRIRKKGFKEWQEQIKFFR